MDVCIVDAENGIASQTNAPALKTGHDTFQLIMQRNSFAVVAKEVRNLSNKSLVATKETKVIVESVMIANPEATVMAGRKTS